MGKIIVMGEFLDKKQKDNLLSKIQEKVDEIEKELGLEEPLTVLTDDCVLSVINNLIDAKESIDTILDTFNYDGECEELE